MNLLMWACVGALGIACSYYSSGYIANGIIHISNNYLNINLDHGTVEGFVMGSLCLTVVMAVGPHMADSFLNIMFSNMDYGIYTVNEMSGHTMAAINDTVVLRDWLKPVTVALNNPEHIAVLNTVLADKHNLFLLKNENIFSYIIPYATPVTSLLNDIEFVTQLDVIYTNKIHEASIYVFDNYIEYNRELFNVYEKFTHLQEAVLIKDAQFIRIYYLCDMLLYDRMKGNLVDSIISDTLIDYMVQRTPFDKVMCCNIQFLDTMYRLGSSANGLTISPFELALRSQFALTYFPFEEGHTVIRFLDGSVINGENIFRRDVIMNLWFQLLDPTTIVDFSNVYGSLCDEDIINGVD